MSDYKFKQTNQNRFLDLVFSYTGIFIVMTLAIVCIFFYDMGSYDNLFIIGLLLIIGSMSFYRGIRMQRKQLINYVLTIDNSSVTQAKANTRPLTINFGDIAYILALKNGSILIRQKDSNNFILIPTGIENKAEIINRLEAVMPVTTPKKEINARLLIIVIIVLTVLVFFLFVKATNPLMVITFGISLLTVLIISFISIQKSKVVDSKIKRSSYLVILPFISILAKTVIFILQLFGYKF